MDVDLLNERILTGPVVEVLQLAKPVEDGHVLVNRMDTAFDGKHMTPPKAAEALIALTLTSLQHASGQRDVAQILGGLVETSYRLGMYIHLQSVLKDKETDDNV